MRNSQKSHQKDLTVIKETVKTPVESAQKGKRKRTTSQGDDDYETVVQREKCEEHCPVILFLPETYIQTLKIEDDEGTGDALAEKLYQVLIQQESEETVDIVGSDSCNKNSGQNKGVHTSLEKRLRRPLQRILCLKH